MKRLMKDGYNSRKYTINTLLLRLMISLGCIFVSMISGGIDYIHDEKITVPYQSLTSLSSLPSVVHVNNAPASTIESSNYLDPEMLIQMKNNMDLHRYRRNLMMNKNNHIPLVFRQKSSDFSTSKRKLQSDWSGYDGDQRVFIPQTAFSKADLCTGSVCTSLYIFSTKAPSSNNISLSVKETEPDQDERMQEIFRNIRSDDKGVASMNTFKKLDFSIFDSSGPSGQDYFYFEGTISFPETTRSSALAVLSDSPYSYLWMISDAKAQTKCVGYNGSIIFNNAINSGETIYIQATYPSDAYSKNNIYDNGNKSDCKWLEFGVDTNAQYETVSFLEPICQDGPVLWSFYTSMECTEQRKFASKIIDTNFTSQVPIDDGGNTVYCIITDNSGLSSSDDAVTCIGGMDFFNVTDIYNAPLPLPPFYSWYAQYGRVVMGTIFGACFLSILFYISWLRRAEEGDVVLYRLDAVVDKPHVDDEENQQGKREFSNKSISWYQMMRQKKDTKKYGIAVVVRGKRSLQLRPLRKLVGYCLDPVSIQSRNELNVQRAPSTEIVRGPNGELISTYDYKGGSDSNPDTWAMVEEEDDHTILDMSMFSIHSVLWNVTRGVFIDKEKYEQLNEDKAAKEAKEASSVLDQFNIDDRASSPFTGMRRRNRKRVGVLSDGKDITNSNKKVSEMKTPKKYEEIPLLLDFDDIADMTDTIEENELHGIRGFFIHAKLDWNSIDVLTSMRLDDYVLSSSVTALSTSELFVLRYKRTIKSLKKLFTFRRRGIAALDKPGDIDLMYRADATLGNDDQHVAENSSPQSQSNAARDSSPSPKKILLPDISSSTGHVDYTQVADKTSVISPGAKSKPYTHRQAMDFSGVKSPLVESPSAVPRRMGPIIPPITSPITVPQQELVAPLPLNSLGSANLMINQKMSAVSTSPSGFTSPRVPNRKLTLYDKANMPKPQPTTSKHIDSVDYSIIEQKYKEKLESDQREEIINKIISNNDNGQNDELVAELKRQKEVSDEIGRLEQLQADLERQKEAIRLEEERLRSQEKQKSFQQRIETLQRFQSGETVTGASPHLLATATMVASAGASNESKLHIDTTMGDVDDEDAIDEFNLLRIESDKGDEHREPSSTSDKNPKSAKRSTKRKGSVLKKGHRK